jgi:hypothetical protein
MLGVLDAVRRRPPVTRHSAARDVGIDFGDHRGLLEHLVRRVASLLNRLGREVRVFVPAASVGNA